MQYVETRVKLEDVPRLLKIPKSQCQDFWIRLPPHKWPKPWANSENPVILRERYFIWSLHLLASCGKDHLKGSSATWMEKSTELRMSILFIESRDCSFSVYVDDRKKRLEEYLNPMWRKWMKLVDQDEPTSLLDNVN